MQRGEEEGHVGAHEAQREERQHRVHGRPAHHRAQRGQGEEGDVEGKVDAQRPVPRQHPLLHRAGRHRGREQAEERLHMAQEVLAVRI